jgi:hypothetical protein
MLGGFGLGAKSMMLNKAGFGEEKAENKEK